MYCNFKIHLQQLDVKFKMSDSEMNQADAPEKPVEV